jgi:serine/threonine-protein kinase ULK/ATG1
MSKLIDNFIIVSTLKSTDEWEKHKGRNLLTKELVLIKTVKLERFNADTALKERVLN